MKIAPRSKLLFIGDSITDAAGTNPAFGGLGNGYVQQIEALLTSTYPEHRIRVMNTGIGGHTVRDLKARWQADVFDLAPDWLSIMIGINDVWRQFDCPLQPATHVGIEEYEATLNELVETTAPRVKGLVLMTPYYIEPNPQDAMRARMDQYGAAVKRIAAKHKTLLVDTQAAFNAFTKIWYPTALCWDRVHPNQAGHMILAKAFLNAVGYQW